MKTLVTLCLAIALAACASFDGRGLVPGQSTAADVESVMGAPAETRKMANGETWLYYPRQPYGRVTFVARLGPDGRLLATSVAVVAGPSRAGSPIQTCPSANRSAFQIGARAFVSSIA